MSISFVIISLLCYVANAAQPFTNRDELKTEVKKYCSDAPSYSFTKYGKIEDWDVSRITSMYQLFVYQKECNPNIAAWNVGKVTNFARMFDGTTYFNQNILKWNTSSGIKFYSMFNSAKTFSQDLSRWDVSSGEKFGSMFYKASSFNQDLSGWDVSSGQGFDFTFYEATSFNQDLSRWNVSSGLDFRGMFDGATSFDQDISGWDVSSGLKYTKMMYGATSFNQDISEWDVSSGLEFNDMFFMAENFCQDLSSWPSVAKNAKSFCPTPAACNILPAAPAPSPRSSFLSAPLLFTFFSVCAFLGALYSRERWCRQSSKPGDADGMALRTMGKYAAVSQTEVWGGNRSVTADGLRTVNVGDLDDH